MKALGQLLGVYNKREFTFSRDTLHALDGIISSLTAFDDGFLWGLPLMFFDLALLWQPQERLTRRSRSKVGPDDIVPPSWSWAGWQGELDTDIWTSGIEKNEGLSRPICSAVSWYLFDLVSGKETPFTDCVFPLHINDMRHLLSCKVERCFLSLGKRHSRFRGRSFELGYYYSLFDNQGTWAGSLRPHYDSQIEVTPGTSPQECEIVSISHGVVNNSPNSHSAWIDEWDLPDRPKLTERYEFHNVLWIIWENGIAYRQGLGRVMKEVWEQQKAEEILLVLG
jgi:hypothetical protein